MTLRHYNFAWLIPDSGDPRSDAIAQEAFEHEAMVRGPDDEPAGYDGAPLFGHGQDGDWGRSWGDNQLLWYADPPSLALDLAEADDVIDNIEGWVNGEGGDGR